MKTCHKCKVAKPYSEFTKDGYRSDGRDSRCRSCKRVAIAEWKRGDTKDKKITRVLKKELLRELKSKNQKLCAHCGEIKTLEDFYISLKRGPFSECKQCAAKIAASPGYRKEVSNRSRQLKYGLSREDFDQIRLNQKNQCAVCGRAFEKTPVVDHCHSSGKIRGLLCRGCNFGLGIFQDNPSRLFSAAAYLQRTS